MPSQNEGALSVKKHGELGDDCKVIRAKCEQWTYSTNNSHPAVGIIWLEDFPWCRQQLHFHPWCSQLREEQLRLPSQGYFASCPDFSFLDFLISCYSRHIGLVKETYPCFSLVLISFSSTFFFCPGYFLCPHCGLQVHTLSLELFSAIALCVEEDHDVLVTAPPYSTKPPSHKVTGHAHTSANLCDKYRLARFRGPPSL